MGKLVRLELNNFKSYRGHHVLLFGDSYFTSIIGPNGSGKSNSMDAISFVLGIKSSHLRSTQLRELIYRGRVAGSSKINADGTATDATNGDANGTQTNTQRDDPQSAWVMAVYVDDTGEEHKWRRTITSAGVSEYRINKRNVTAKQYNEALEAEDILIKARNFLVFQGDVESVASQSPKDLTHLIEQISGSLEYKAEYERLKIESEKMIEDQTFKLNQRRSINAEIKTYQEQKAEAEEYERKMAERDHAIVTHVLWKLFNFQKTMDESSDEIQKHQQELKEHKRGVEEYQQKLDQATKAQAQVKREVNKTEKAIKDKEKDMEDAQNGMVPIDEKIRTLKKELQGYEKTIEQRRDERDRKNVDVEKHKNSLAMVQKAQKKWENDFKKLAQQEGRELSEDDLQEYNQLRGEVTKRSHQNQIEVDNLTRNIKTNGETVNILRSKVESAQAQMQKLEDDIKMLQQRQQDLKTQSKELEVEKSSKDKEYHRIQSDRIKGAQARTELEERLQNTLRSLREAEFGQQQSERERRTRATILEMKGIYPGVHGRYSDLCRPKQKKYETAVSTLLGWHLDAIIVDKDTTAKECISYLKAQKLGQFSFIPLDTISIKAVNPNLKGMHKGMRLGIDCIDYEPHLERAMASACGNSIICDTLEIAKHLFYERGVDAKAVTLDGSVISKGGTMTGGRLGSDRGSRRWADDEVEKLHALYNKIKANLDALPIPRRGQEEDLTGEIQDLDQKLRFAKDEVQTLERNIQSKKKEHSYVKGQLQEAQPKYQENSQRLQNMQSNLEKYQRAVDQVANEVFAAFCQRLGYNNIREYEAQQGSIQEEASTRKLEFTKQRSRLENLIAFEENSLGGMNEAITSLDGKTQRNQNLIESLEGEKDELQNNVDQLTAELENLQEILSSLNQKLERRAQVVNESRRDLETRNASVKGVIKAVETLEAEIKRTATSRYALLRKCRVDEIKIPLAEGSASLTSLPMGDIEPQQDADAMDIDEDPDITTIQAPEIDDYGIEVDFDNLDDKLKEDESPACEAKLQDTINNLTAEIEKSNPNMRAIERLETTSARLKSTERDFETARRLAKRAKDDFEDVKQKRYDLFTKAFDHISEQIGSTYADLTKSLATDIGGSAYLDLEDTTEPYLAGLKYHATPPLKRFRDMEHLSGGEKTIAALALLFAIHSYQPSPFFVLDEVDAALDTVNVARVANYVKRHANPGMQFIVISLKAGLFQESQSLVGVMRDQGRMSSRTVSLDLRKYLAV